MPYSLEASLAGSLVLSFLSVALGSEHTSSCDSYIRSGSPTTNFGSTSTMVSNDNGSDVRIAVMSFDLSTKDVGEIEAAKLELTAVIGNYNGAIDLYGLTDSSEGFVETTLTWSNAAFLEAGEVDLTKVYEGRKLGTFNNTANARNVVFEVTSGSFLNFLNASTDNEVTFLLVDTNPNASGVGWATREDANAARRPVLTLNEASPPTDPQAPTTKLRVLLVGGQSNADGRASANSLTTTPVNLQLPQDDVDFFYKVQGGNPILTTLRPGLSETSSFGPAVTFGRSLADLYSGEEGTRVALIKYANGGTNLANQWKAGGDGTTAGDGAEYVTFQQTVSQGLVALQAAYPDATVKVEGMTWMQGESDATSSRAASYETNLKNFIGDLRLTYGAELPFIIGRLSSGQTNLNATYLNQIRAAQAAVAAGDERTGLVDTDTFSLKGDNLHFNAEGNQSMGDAFAQQAAYYIWMNETFSQQEVEAGKAEPSADLDQDGKSNHDEFLGDSDPRDSESVFNAYIELPAVGHASISYTTSKLRVYRVETYNSVPSDWVELLPYERGSGSMVSRSVTLNAASQIFRVRSALP